MCVWGKIGETVRPQEKAGESRRIWEKSGESVRTLRIAKSDVGVLTAHVYTAGCGKVIVVCSRGRIVFT